MHVARLTAMLALAFLTGCQAPHPPSASPALLNVAQLTQQWQGNLSIKLGAWGTQGTEGQSFTFFLQAGQQAGQLDLMTPLGTQLAQVRWTEQATTIESAEGTQHFNSLTELSEKLLGEDVPLQALPYWLQGQIAPTLAPPQPRQNPEVFQQAGWSIDAQYLNIGKLQVTRAETATQRQITIKVRLER